MLQDSGLGRLDDGAARERAHSVLALREQNLPGEVLHLLAKDVLERLARRSVLSASSAPARPDVELDSLCDALISADPDAALALVMKFREQGATTEAIYLSYVAVAARRLGERWENDEVTFVDVNLAAARLYVIMHTIRPLLLSEASRRENTSHALFASTPGEIHTLGVSMAADLFQARGWDIDLLTGLDHDELVDQIGHDKYYVIGLSASSERSIAPLARLIASLRVASPISSILVSGELATIESNLAMLVDADSVAMDAATAVTEMQRLLDATLAAAA